MATALFERELLLEQLAAALRDAAEGRGTIVLIEGEAGSGKTSLLRAAFDGGADFSTPVWWGWCDPLPTPRPLGPLFDIAPRLGIDVAEDAFATFDELLAALREKPAVIVIEDAHWADAPTLSMLQYLGRRIGESHGVLAVTYRDDVGAPLRRVLGELPRDHVRRLHVPPLSPEAVATIAAEANLDPDTVYELTGGNAFFVIEVVASGGALPASVSDAVLSRIARLPVAVRDYVERVSTEPGGLELRDDADPADNPETADGILVTDGRRVGFKHELARRAVYDALPARRRIQLHRGQLATTDSADLTRLAHHALGTEDPDLIVRTALPAAEHARRRGAYREAASLYVRVLAHAERLSAAEEIDAWLALGDLRGILGEHEQALTAIRCAIARAAQAGDRLRQGWATSVLSSATWRAGAVGEAARLDEAALELLRPLGHTQQLAEALASSASGAMLARRHGRAVQRAREACIVAAACDAAATEVSAQIAEASAELVTGDAERGIASLLDALQQTDARGDARLATYSLVQLASGAGEIKRYEQALQWGEQAIARARTRDDDYLVAYVHAWQSRIRFEQGHWEEAAHLATETDRGHATPLVRATALGVVGRLRVRRGDPRPLEPLYEADAALRGLELQHRWPYLCGIAEQHWLVGDLPTAVSVLQPAYEQALDTDSGWAKGEIGHWLWRSGGLDAAPPGAAEPWAAQISGDWRSAAALWERIGCPYERALALLDGDAEVALEGLAILDQLGARPAAGWARRKLAGRGFVVPRSPRRSTLANPLGLTEREAEIHALLLEGLDNSAIAGRLFLSQRTVEHHVSAVLRKLGVNSRKSLT